MCASVSVVMPGRNDGHGGDFLRRLRTAVDTIDVLADRTDTETELVLVEWNPPTDRPGLASVLDSPTTDRFEIRVVTVSSDYHERFPNAETTPLFQEIAKNVGVRRATGRAVLATNADVIVNEDMMRFLGSSDVTSGAFYRASRHDVDVEVPLDTSVDERLAVCRQNVAEVRAMNGPIPQAFRPKIRDLYKNVSKYWAEVEARLRPGLVSDPRKFRHLHTFAAGDFLLMTPDAWETVRGFPEYGWHLYVDSYACAIAVAQGLRQEIVRPPPRIYHQMHDRSGSGSRYSGRRERYVSETSELIASRDEERIRELANDADWGLGGEDLPEEALSG